MDFRIAIVLAQSSQAHTHTHMEGRREGKEKWLCPICIESNFRFEIVSSCKQIPHSTLLRLGTILCSVDTGLIGGSEQNRTEENRWDTWQPWEDQMGDRMGIEIRSSDSCTHDGPLASSFIMYLLSLISHPQWMRQFNFFLAYIWHVTIAGHVAIIIGQEQPQWYIIRFGHLWPTSKKRIGLSSSDTFWSIKACLPCKFAYVRVNTIIGHQNSIECYRRMNGIR